MKLAWLSILIPIAILYFVFSGIIQSPTESIVEEPRYSKLYLNDESNNKLISFSIDNKEGMDFNYVYEIYEETSSDEQLLKRGVVSIRNRESSLIYYTVSSDAVRKVRISVPLISQQVTYLTGNKPKQWAPEIEPDLEWEKQDPITQHYYKYI